MTMSVSILGVHCGGERLDCLKVKLIQIRDVPICILESLDVKGIELINSNRNWNAQKEARKSNLLEENRKQASRRG
jgi:hypothetical protein